MSRGGRRRLWRAGLKTGAITVFVAAIAWGGWLLTAELRPLGKIPGAVGARPVRVPELRTNGVLSAASLAQRLALPKGVALMDLDLDLLRERLVDDGQIEAATLTRHFPDRLQVTLAERFPVARLMANWKGSAQRLLVARDGVVFVGEGFDAAMIDSLPWLDGITLARQGTGFQPIAGMNSVAELLARRRENESRASAEDPRRVWQIISLARLATDRELEVQTLAGSTLVFSANGDFLRQLAKLDFVWDALANAPTPPARIDLTFGREVPVALEAAPAPAASNALFSPSGVRDQIR
jgi:cell division protein FtsQ